MSQDRRLGIWAACMLDARQLQFNDAQGVPCLGRAHGSNNFCANASCAAAKYFSLQLGVAAKVDARTGAATIRNDRPYLPHPPAKEQYIILPSPTMPSVTDLHVHGVLQPKPSPLPPPPLPPLPPFCSTKLEDIYGNVGAGPSVLFSKWG